MKHLPQLLRLLQIQLSQLLLKKGSVLLQRLQLLLTLCQALCQVLADSLRRRLRCRNQLFKLRVLGAVELLHHRQGGLPRRFSLSFQLVGLCTQAQGKLLVQVGAENLTENLLLFLAGSVQKAAEFSLCQHDNLAELLAA